MSNLDDLRAWPGSGLPISGEWNATGFGPDWYATQIQAGHRLMLTINDFGTRYDDAPGRLKWITSAPHAAALDYLGVNGLPIAIRPNINWEDMMVDSNFNGVVPLDAGVIDSPWPQTYKVVDGVTKQAKRLDTLASPLMWGAEGERWGKSAYVRELQRRVPNPSCVLWLNNNEGLIEDWRSFTSHGKIGKDGIIPHAWLSADAISALSIRMSARVSHLGFTSNPYGFVPEFSNRQAAQVQAMLNGVRSQLSPAWAAASMSGAYKVSDSPGEYPANVVAAVGNAPSSLKYDSLAAQMYIRPNMRDFTQRAHLDPLDSVATEWARYRAANPRKYVELFAWIGGGGIAGAWRDGIHDPITPVQWQSFLEWALWTMQAPGMPVVIRDYRGSATSPDDVIWNVPDDGETAPAIPPGLENAKVQEWVEASFRAVNRISEDPLLRDFWLNGKSIPVPQAAPQRYKLAVVRKDPDWLIKVWSPFAGFTDRITVALGSQSIEVIGAGEWLATPPQVTGLVLRKLS